MLTNYVFAIIRFMYFARLNEELGAMINQIGCTLAEMGEVITFYVIIVCTFGMANHMMDDNSELTLMLNSVGSITTPSPDNGS